MLGKGGVVGVIVRNIQKLNFNVIFFLICHIILRRVGEFSLSYNFFLLKLKFLFLDNFLYDHCYGMTNTKMRGVQACFYI